MTTVGLNTADPASVPVRDAATVVVVRQGGDGIEVCMLQRNLNSDFVGGAYVFPGGGVDPDDGDERYGTLLTAELPRRVEGAGEGLAFRVAAARESFEEAGILFARDREGRTVALDDPRLTERFRRHRVDVDSGSRKLFEICAEEQLSLDLARMSYLSRWVTPFGANRRYDTRFFVAEAPAGQEALHDDHEVIDTIWISPEQALADAREGRRTMIFPTVRTMVQLSRFDEVGQLFAHVESVERVEPIQPEIRPVDDRLELVLPGDPEGVGGLYDAITGEPLGA